jgi:glycosyltransferase involved in cell wall biosynthesis
MIVPGFAALREHVPVRILSRHMPYPFKNRLGTVLYSKVLFTRMITVSNSVRETLLRCGVAPSKIEVIHHGTDVEAFAQTTLSVREARAQMGISEDRIAVGIIGRIAPEKGHRFLLKAAQILGDSYPLQFVVIGNGPDEEAVRRSVVDLGLRDRVIFTGFRDDVNNATNALDIVAVPSTWNEPCSAVVQQAMALSKPVIGTRVGGTPEMVIEGKTGLLVPPSDSEALAQAIRCLAGDAFLRKRMGKAGHELVEAEFSLRGMTDKIEALYRRQYEGRRGAEALQKVHA